MMIEPGKEYRIRSSSKYFTEKYGTPNPTFVAEDRATKIFGGPWYNQNGNPACLLFAMRSAFEKLPLEPVWYGHIGALGELAHESELEPLPFCG